LKSIHQGFVHKSQGLELWPTEPNLSFPLMQDNRRLLRLSRLRLWIQFPPEVQGGRETNPMYGFVNQSVTLLVWTRVVQMSASPGTNNSTAHIMVSASHHGLSMRSSIDSSMRDSKWLSEPFPSLIQLQIWSSCTCVNGWICTYILLEGASNLFVCFSYITFLLL